MSLAEPIRVMVVDDSTVIRGLVTRALETDPAIKVLSSVGDGQMAVNALKRQPVDVIVLDIEMPVMTGIEAIPKLLEVNPHVKIVMSSTLTLNNAEISLQALALGASDYIPKPTSTKEMTGADDFKHALIAKVKTLGGIAQATHDRLAGRTPAATPTTPGAPPAPVKQETVTLRSDPPVNPQVLAIGSSTGGPQALFAVIKHLKGLKQPIVITQHMPPTFTTILAQHITAQTGVPCTEAKTGDALEPGKALVAPGDYHMTFTSDGPTVRVMLTQSPPENFCRPAVDPMLRSLSGIYGKNLLVTILTGMGDDGARGSQTVVDAGGTVIAQDEASSVVWGMPGAVAKAGLCSAVMPLDNIGPWLRERAMRA